MKAYINYPNPHFTIHWDDDCAHVRKQKKAGQRVVSVTRANVDTVLSRFIAREFKFGATSDENDMWLDVSLGSPKHDEALVYVIQAILGQRYTLLASASVENHAC